VEPIGWRAKSPSGGQRARAAKVGLVLVALVSVDSDGLSLPLAAFCSPLSARRSLLATGRPVSVAAGAVERAALVFLVACRGLGARTGRQWKASGREREREAAFMLSCLHATILAYYIGKMA